MACIDCITYKFTNDEGIGTIEFIAEDPNGLSLEVQSITLIFTDSEGEETEFLVLPDWFVPVAVGDLISVGGLYRLTLTVTFDFFAANEAGFGPGEYSGRVCFKRTDGSYTDLCCDYEVCSDGVEDLIPVFTPNRVFAGGAWNPSNKRITSCGLNGENEQILFVSGDLDTTDSVTGLAFDIETQQLFFKHGSGPFDDRIYVCPPDGSSYALFHDFNNGIDLDYIFVPKEGGVIYAVQGNGDIFVSPTASASFVLIGEMPFTFNLGPIRQDGAGLIYIITSSGSQQPINRYNPATGVMEEDWKRQASPDGTTKIEYDPVRDQFAFFDSSNSGSIAQGWSFWTLDIVWDEFAFNEAEPLETFLLLMEDEIEQRMYHCVTRLVRYRSWPDGGSLTTIFNDTSGTTGTISCMTLGRINE